MGKLTRILAATALLVVTLGMKAQSFQHPALANTHADLDFIKSKVEAKEQPWYGAWQIMCNEWMSNSGYTTPGSNNGDIGGSDGNRQRASRDSQAAYCNLLRWYVEGDESHAKCAANIVNKWTQTITKMASEQLFQLPIVSMVNAAEILKLYDGWSEASRDSFKTMCMEKWYPSLKGFLAQCGSWPSWDGPANLGCLCIGVYCDDKAIVDEAIRYYKYGAEGTGFGGGCLNNMIFNDKGQSIEMGRDLPHAELGPDAAALFCEIAWNNGIDLWSYQDNLLLKGMEYLYRYDLEHKCDWEPYNDCADRYFYNVSLRYPFRITGFPGIEAAFNHYVLRKGLKAPYMTNAIKLRGLQKYTWNACDYTMLTYMGEGIQDYITKLDNPGSPYAVEAVPLLGGIRLKWQRPDWQLANGSIIERREVGSGEWKNVYTYTNNTSTEYVDTPLVDGKTYEYRIALVNNDSQGDWCNTVRAKATDGSTSFPDSWKLTDIGDAAGKGNATYYEGNGHNIALTSMANEMKTNGAADNMTFMYKKLTGSFTITGRIYAFNRCDGKSDMFGLMIRESLASGARMAAVGQSGTDGRFAYANFRKNASSTAVSYPGDTHTFEGSWFKLVRKGSTFTAYQCFDGINWQEVYSTTISGFSSTCYVGLFASRGWAGPNGPTKVYFDNVSIASSSGADVCPKPQDFKADKVNAMSVDLSWEGNDNVTSYALKCSEKDSDHFFTIADAYVGNSITHNGLKPSTTYLYVLTAQTISGTSTSDTLTITTSSLSAPTKPEALKATPNITYAFVDWDAQIDVEDYVIKRSLVKDGLYDVVATVDATNLKQGSFGRVGYLDETAIVGNTYYYMVCSRNAMGTSEYGGPIEVTVALQQKLAGETAKESNQGSQITIDLGESKSSIVTQVRYKPQSAHLDGFVGSRFYGANNSDFSDSHLLYEVDDAPSSSSIWTRQSVFDTTPFRYLRFVSPLSGVEPSEIAFYGISDMSTKVSLPMMVNDMKEWYTINGIKIEKMSRKGVYISNGKKLYVK